MMDSDQEVTREPFEENVYDEAETEDESHSELQTIDSSNDPEPDGNHDEISSCDSVEDVNYAKQFGIDLKTATSQSAYERLINSNCFKTTQVTDESEGRQPVINTSTTTDCIYHKGTFYQKGDIVALCDQDDGQVYFAQIRGFLQDQFCEKSASLNWLVPMRPTSRDFFDPAAYKIGLEDTQLRKLDCMTFVRHCPHDYYVNKFFQDPGQELVQCNTGESLEPTYRKKGGSQAFIWTSMKPCSVPQFGPDVRPTT